MLLNRPSGVYRGWVTHRSKPGELDLTARDHFELTQPPGLLVLNVISTSDLGFCPSCYRFWNAVFLPLFVGHLLGSCSKHLSSSVIRAICSRQLGSQVFYSVASPRFCYSIWPGFWWLSGPHIEHFNNGTLHGAVSTVLIAPFRNNLTYFSTYLHTWDVYLRYMKQPSFVY